MIGGTRRQVLVALGASAIGLGLSACTGRPAAAPRTSAAAAVVDVSPAVASVRGGTRLVLRGSGLATVDAVRVAGTEVAVTEASASRVVLTAPGTADFAGGTERAELLAGSATVATADVAFGAVDGIDRQLQYVLQHWEDYNPEYEALGSTDCVDFMSQSLLERGWEQQGEWTHAVPVASSGGAWISSTLFRDFMAAHPELGTALTDDQRAAVRLGDVVQFDWDGTGDRDHTGVVTRITEEDGAIRIGFAGHTLDSDYRDVDEAITEDHPGGTAYYWSLA